MATEETHDDFVAHSSDIFASEEASLNAAIAQATAEINRIRGKASMDDTVSAINSHYSKHEAAGFGTYVVPRRTGWKALIDIIHDPVPNIDFSANIYPNFDGVIGEIFDSPYLLDPLHDKYESYESLRDNLAAVRNFLLQTYYANTPEGMTPVKAKQALTEIATFLGDGLLNNYLYYGLIPNHKPFKPFIDIDKAREPKGRGAQYIYERILEHNRHSSWMRPFDAVKALFGGQTAMDWMLPSASATHFLNYKGYDIAEEAPAPETIEAQNRVAELEARLSAIKDAKAITITAIDLDAIGNHLIYTAQNMSGVAQMSDTTRRDAVDIARDILRKLKISVGNLNVKDGLQMKPSDDMATLGAIKGVAIVYERLLAWARGNNDAAIFQHPSILAANQAIGQFGYLAKLEALRMANLAGNSILATTIAEQLKRLPEGYRGISDVKIGALLEKMERGIDTVINRIQQVSVSGAMVGKGVDNRGTTMDAPPTAGAANQRGADEAAQRNAQLLAAEQLAALAHANRVNQQSQQAQQQSQSGQQQATTQTRSTSSQNRQQAMQSARTQRQNSSRLTAVAPLPGMSVVQFQAMQRNAALRVAIEREDQVQHEQQRLQQQQLQQLQQQQQAKARADAAIAKARASIDPNMMKGFDLKGLDMSKAIMPGRKIDPQNVLKPVVKAQPAATQNQSTKLTAVDEKNPYAVQPSIPPRNPGNGGRGF